MELSPEEMQQVAYKYYFNSPEMSFQQWACRISADRAVFGSVNQPDKIKNITDRIQLFMIPAFL